MYAMTDEEFTQLHNAIKTLVEFVGFLQGKEMQHCINQNNIVLIDTKGGKNEKRKSKTSNL